MRRVKRLLDISMVSEEHKSSFLESVKLVQEDDDAYYTYIPIKLTFDTGAGHCIEWIFDLFRWELDDYENQIRLSVPSDQLEEGEYPNMSYIPQKLMQIQSLLDIICTQKEDEIILFTDEANEGDFVEVLTGKPQSVNYLFDMALLPSEISWQCDESLYHFVTEIHGKMKFVRKR